MDVNTLNDLLTPAGQEAVAAAAALDPKETDFLRHFTSLSREYPREIARAALETAILRRRAAAKFNILPTADKLYLTREALEQASAAEVSEYRAYRYRQSVLAIDVGCSIGGDTMSLAKRTHALGIDNDQVRLHMAVENARIAGLEERTLFVLADAGATLPVSAGRGSALFFDPSRRGNEKRAVSVEQYHPPLGVVRGWLPDFPDLGVKISPAVKLPELKEYERRYGAELEFISLRGELKEGVLWFGSLRTAGEPLGDSPRRRATLLPGPFTLTADAVVANRAATQITPPRAYLYEPDPAVIRAGLISTLARNLNASQLDVDIAFLTADDQASTPFARSWPVEDWMPFGLKKLRAYLRERRVGRVTVKKRGSPVETEKLKRDLRLKGENQKLIVLTHHDGKPIVVVCAEREISGEL